ncbi:MAG TPA: zf-HC2 domain-containing protein [Bryobacteraceae bacterium]|nr:zf-HC2 domain-containing protein [Bryobacteraceae bacterium]
MSHCEECISRIDLFLDDELREDELDIFNRHLNDCKSCREKVAHRRRFFEEIRAARPAHVASPELRAKVVALMPSVSRGHTESIKPKERARSWFSLLGTGPMPALVACGLTIVGAVLLWRFSLKEIRSTAFVDMAEKTYRQQLSGRLPLEIKTSSPPEMSTWFTDKVQFHFRLPNYQEGSGQDQRYKLSGGRLVTFKEDSAAYISYSMKAQLIGLLIVSASNSVASGGEETKSKGLTFHMHRRRGLQVVTWSVHNLTYALVSDVNLPSSQSCAVCHPRAKDRDLIRGLKSGNELGASGQQTRLLSAVDIQHFAAVQ